jgi:hypothetical protein
MSGSFKMHLNDAKITLAASAASRLCISSKMEDSSIVSCYVVPDRPECEYVTNNSSSWWIFL